MKLLDEDDCAVLATDGQLLVRFPDGSTNVCEPRGDWSVFACDGHELEWCAASAVRTSSLVVAVRGRGGARIVGATVAGANAKGAAATEDEARAVVEAQGGAARLIAADAPRQLTRLRTQPPPSSRRDRSSPRVALFDPDVAFVSQLARVPTIDLNAFEIEKGVLECVPWDLCLELVVIPVARHAQSLIVATATPTNKTVLDALAQRTGLKIEPVVAEQSAILAKLARVYPR
jgi:hypothetical protein